MSDQNDSLPAAQVFVEEGRWEQNGVTCPCCRQLVKVYRRSITTSMARVLVALYKQSPRGLKWINVPELLRSLGGTMSQGGDWAKLVHWGLIEFPEDKREDGSRRTGLARITQVGIQFVEGRFHVLKYVYLYNNGSLKHGGPSITIVQALGQPFNYLDIVRTTGADDQPFN